MNDSTRLTDQQITEMLRERVRGPMPQDITAAVLDQVRSASQMPRSARAMRRRGAVLLVAAALVVAGSLIVTSAGGPRRSSGPSESAPAVVAPSMSSRPNASPSADRSSAQTSVPCPAFDGIARSGGAGTGADPVPKPPSDPPVAGDVVVLMSNNDTADPAVFDPLSASPTPVSISPWNLSSWYVTSWNPSADGSVVAPELEGTCNDVFVMRSDGTGLRTPFSALHRSAFAPAWAPDGSFLAVASVPAPATDPSVGQAPSTLLIWDPATDSINDLGRPCETCSPVGWGPGQGIAAWSADSKRIAVDYTDLSCGVASPGPSSGAGCRGIAVATVRGLWQRIPIQADGREAQVRLLTWADDQSLIVLDGVDLSVLTVESGVLRRLPANAADAAMWGLDQTIAPDHTKAITGGGRNGPFMEITDLRSGDATRLEPLPPDWLGVAWSPDSKWILVQADSDGYGANRGLYLIRVDGSQPIRRILPGAFGVMEWMAAGT